MYSSVPVVAKFEITLHVLLLKHCVLFVDLITQLISSRITCLFVITYYDVVTMEIPPRNCTRVCIYVSHLLIL